MQQRPGLRTSVNRFSITQEPPTTTTQGKEATVTKSQYIRDSTALQHVEEVLRSASIRHGFHRREA